MESYLSYKIGKVHLKSIKNSIAVANKKINNEKKNTLFIEMFTFETALYESKVYNATLKERTC